MVSENPHLQITELVYIYCKFFQVYSKQALNALLRRLWHSVGITASLSLAG